MLALVTIAFAPAPVFSQQPGSVPRIGLLWIDSGGSSNYVDAFREGLRAQGYVEGKNISIDDRSLVDGYDGLAAAAGRLAREKVSVIVTYGGTASQAAHKAAPGIPIVMVSGGDPIKLGLVASLSRPGGNVTGTTFLSADLSGKRLELLREIVPRIRRLAVILYPGSSAETEALKQYEAAARALNLEARAVEIRHPGEIDAAIAGIARMDVQAIAVVGSSLFTANRKQVAAAIGRIRIPAVYVNGDFVESGGLIAYGPNYVDQFRRAAVYVGKILKGTKPGDLPIEQPTRLEMVINMKTAKALGLTIPQTILVRADRVIE
jgi:putative ABC transport system substrate-binding protein